MDNDGNASNFAGTLTTLEKLNTDNTWSDVKKLGGYTTAADDMWEFVQWDDQVIATNFGDPIQSFDLSSSSLFADLAASAPKARHITVVREFVVVGNTNDATDGNVPFRVRWGPIGDPAGDWAVSAATQADFQDLSADDGWVMGIVGS